MNTENYATETRKARRKGFEGTQEFFTPGDLINMMCDKVPIQKWTDPNALFLEPCAGNGNFVVEIIRRRIESGIHYIQALKTCYSVELMEDNVTEQKQRVMCMLREMVPDFDEDVARKIMDNNMVCSDFFKWDFDNWKLIEDTDKTDPLW